LGGLGMMSPTPRTDCSAPQVMRVRSGRLEAQKPAPRGGSRSIHARCAGPNAHRGRPRAMVPVLRRAFAMRSFRPRHTLTAAIATAWLLSSFTARGEPPAAGPAIPEAVSGESPVPAPPLRHSGKRLYWDSSFDRMDTPEMILTGVAAAIAVATNVVRPLNTGWKGGILFDDQLRSLRLPTLDARLEVRSGTDVGLAVMTTYPILVDSIIVAYWYRGSDDVALQMALIDAEAFAITGAIEGASNFLSGRARPYSADCGAGVPNNTTDCESDTRYRSFFSGHTAVSFTAAGLICAHHEALALFDGPADHVMCATGFVAAATIGTLRILGDAHYFSDVFVGALVGTAVGLGIPLLHHYKRAPTSDVSSDFSLKIVPGIGGGQLVGTF
jgi:membrane-associated phospholipid phosphatase